MLITMYPESNTHAPLSFADLGLQHFIGVDDPQNISREIHKALQKYRLVDDWYGVENMAYRLCSGFGYASRTGGRIRGMHVNADLEVSVGKDYFEIYNPGNETYITLPAEVVAYLKERM